MVGGARQGRLCVYKRTVLEHSQHQLTNMDTPIVKKVRFRRRRLFEEPTRGYFWGSTSKIQVISASDLEFCDNSSDTNPSESICQPPEDTSTTKQEQPKPSNKTPLKSQSRSAPPTPPHWRCSFCLLEFLSKLDRNRHIRKKHQQFQLV